MTKIKQKGVAEKAPAASPRVYDKGERRHKHVGKSDVPEIEFHSDNPKYWIGKCPINISDAEKAKLLNEALPANNGDREIDFPKKLFVVDKGAIYVAQTTDRGHTYHGYPYRGKLPKSLLERLRKTAQTKGCEAEFQQWVKSHIELHG